MQKNVDKILYNGMIIKECTNIIKRKTNDEARKDEKKIQ